MDALVSKTARLEFGERAHLARMKFRHPMDALVSKAARLEFGERAHLARMKFRHVGGLSECLRPRRSLRHGHGATENPRAVLDLQKLVAVRLEQDAPGGPPARPDRQQAGRHTS